ncbi:hypothetical protein GCM10009680_34170 [Streptomyces yatensis]|uniref:Uncharacterized protein n=1 Tax=Streptomyces yatensis TaxID=155177 RepID=A0ABN2HRF1_9ACTN
MEPAGTVRRVGTVVMNSPFIVSTPGSSGGRPDTVVPKTTSSRPDCRASSSAQAPCTTVFRVSPSPRASS